MAYGYRLAPADGVGGALGTHKHDQGRRIWTLAHSTQSLARICKHPSLIAARDMTATFGGLKRLLLPHRTAPQRY